MINMFRIVSFVLSVPGSNAFVETILSLMTTKQSDSRNSAELIKNELQISVNCDLSRTFLRLQKRTNDCLNRLRAAKNIQGKIRAGEQR